MTQSNVDRAVARATGESLSTIRQMGFQIEEPDGRVLDPEPAAPQVIDWDELHSQRMSYLPQQKVAA